MRDFCHSHRTPHDTWTPSAHRELDLPARQHWVESLRDTTLYSVRKLWETLYYTNVYYHVCSRSDLKLFSPRYLCKYHLQNHRCNISLSSIHDIPRPETVSREIYTNKNPGIFRLYIAFLDKCMVCDFPSRAWSVLLSNIYTVFWDDSTRSQMTPENRPFWISFMSTMKCVFSEYIHHFICNMFFYWDVFRVTLRLQTRHPSRKYISQKNHPHWDDYFGTLFSLRKVRRHNIRNRQKIGINKKYQYQKGHDYMYHPQREEKILGSNLNQPQDAILPQTNP